MEQSKSGVPKASLGKEQEGGKIPLTISTSHTISGIPQVTSDITQVDSVVSQLGSDITPVASELTQVDSMLPQLGSNMTPMASDLTQADSMIPHLGSDMTPVASDLTRTGSIVLKVETALPQVDSGSSWHNLGVEQVDSVVLQVQTGMTQPSHDEPPDPCRQRRMIQKILAPPSAEEYVQKLRKITEQVRMSLQGRTGKTQGAMTSGRTAINHHGPGRKDDTPAAAVAGTSQAQGPEIRGSPRHTSTRSPGERHPSGPSTSHSPGLTRKRVQK